MVFLSCFNLFDMNYNDIALYWCCFPKFSGTTQKFTTILRNDSANTVIGMEYLALTQFWSSINHLILP